MWLRSQRCEFLFSKGKGDLTLINPPGPFAHSPLGLSCPGVGVIT